jgi:hypothetical protein
MKILHFFYFSANQWEFGYSFNEGDLKYDLKYSFWKKVSKFLNTKLQEKTNQNFVYNNKEGLHVC